MPPCRKQTVKTAGVWLLGVRLAYVHVDFFTAPILARTMVSWSCGSQTGPHC